MTQLRSFYLLIFTSLKSLLYSSITSKKIFQSTSILLFSNVIVSLFGIVRTPLITWIFPKNEVGMIGVVTSWLPFIHLISMSGIDAAAYHYVTKGRTNAFSIGVQQRFLWSILGAFSFGVGAAYWFFSDKPDLGWIFTIAAVSFPLTYALNASPGFLGSQGKIVSLFWYRIGESLTDFSGFIPVLLSIIWINQITTFYTTNQIATAVMQITVTGILLIQIKKKVFTPLPVEEKTKMLAYGKHLTALTGIGVLQSKTDAFLVAAISPLETVADYSIALIIQEQLRRLWGIFSTLRYPVLVRLPLAVRRKRFIIEGSLLLLVLTLAAILITVLSYWLIPIILPENYSTSLNYLVVLLVATLVGMPGGLVEMYYRTQEDQKHQYWLRVFGAIMGIIFPLLLVVKFGAFGAAVGRMVANFFFSLFGLFLFIRQTT
jgi:O-antigen/teichoic acid export membrane protein